MGLRQPATKVWEIPEPTPALLPKQEPATTPAPVEAPEKQRELEPSGPFWRRK